MFWALRPGDLWLALFPAISTILGFLAITAVLVALGLAAALAVEGPRTRLVEWLTGLERHPIGWAWAAALIATIGSLYLSEVVQFVPCSLCWYQRIAMYPLVVVLGVAILGSESGVWRYALPLAVVGLAIAIYHVVIQWQPNLDVGACTGGAPCTGRYLAVFGFVSIPTMAGAAFLMIISLLVLVRTLERADGTPHAPPAEDIP